MEADRALKGGTPGEVVLAALVAVMAGDRKAALDVPFGSGADPRSRDGLSSVRGERSPTSQP